MPAVVCTGAPDSEESRFDAALHAIGVYQRARLIRRLAVMMTVAIAATRLVLIALGVPVGDKDMAMPALMGISLLVSFFSITLEWSTRTQCNDALDEFQEFVPHDEPQSRN